MSKISPEFLSNIANDKDLPDGPNYLPSKELKDWAEWFQARLDRIEKQMACGDKEHEDYCGYEWELYQWYMNTYVRGIK